MGILDFFCEIPNKISVVCEIAKSKCWKHIKYMYI